MIEFKEFVPEVVERGFLTSRVEEVRQCLQRANEWIASEDIEVINLETIVLPNLHTEDGPEDTQIHVNTDFAVTWNQFIRVWYRRNT